MGIYGYGGSSRHVAQLVRQGFSRQEAVDIVRVRNLAYGRAKRKFALLSAQAEKRRAKHARTR